jgi:Photosynthesis system II assembly factor YCF48/Putative zinc-finger
MEALPKIVRQRLQVTAKPGVHPRADLLTAFAEKALTERERSRVIEHLSRCEDCREVVFLAAPQDALAPVAGKPSQREAWLGWSALRWGTALACVVVVGTAVTLFREGQNRRQVGGTVANEKAASPAPASSPAGAGEVASEEKPGSPAAAGHDVARASVALPNVAATNVTAANVTATNADKDAGARESAAKVEPAMRPSRKAMTATPRVRMQFDQSREINQNGFEADGEATSTAAAANGPPPPAPAVLAEGGNVAAQSASGQRQTKAAASQYAGAPGLASEVVEVSPGGQGSSDSGSTIVKTESPAPSAVTDGQAMASPTVDATAENRNFAALQKKELDRAAAKLETRWRLTPAGALQRSEDAGKTWEMAAIAGKGPFQSFAAAGSEVWLGGPDGILYHSSDAGLHWVRVMPRANGVGPGGGITRIEFRDVQNGTVTTATGESWTTSDAGKTWQKN